MIKVGGPALIIALLVFAIAACGGSASQKTSSPTATVTFAATPPSSTQPAAETLAFSIAGSIYTVRPDGTDLRQLLVAGDERYAAPALSPDGQRLAYIVDYKRVVVTDASDIASVLSDIDLFVDRTPPTPIASNWSMGPMAVHWSPDGETLLVTRQRLSGSGVSDVLVMNVSGTDLRIVLTSGLFIEATWWPGAQGEPGRILVVAADFGLTATIYDLDGEPVGTGLPVTTSRSAVASHAHPREERALITSTLGSPTPFKIIEIEDADGRRVVAEGCGATWSPDGTRIAFYDGIGIVIKNPDITADETGLIVTNAELGLAEEGELREDLCEGLGISWAAGANVYRADHIGLEFAYPSSWIEGAADSPVRPCSECLVFGPAQAAQPYGIRWFFRNYPEGCPSPACVMGNGRRQLSEPRTFDVYGHEASQIDVMAGLPLGLREEMGGFFEYREVWTAIRLEDESATFFVAFYRDGDMAAEAETLAAYDALLASLGLPRLNVLDLQPG
ncbi:MAG: PD40 domain-containing protein [Chloroflexi bacterium]|nr:PD40 domain-containing protein [Chloroflexota bacterium]